MDVHLVTDSGISSHTVAELPALLSGEGITWVDIPVVDDAAAAVLRDVFHFHPLAIRDCMERNRVPRVHAYPDHVLLILHTPESGTHGHVHYIELDQFVGRNYLVTVHGPINPAVNPEVALRQTKGVARRIEAGRSLPKTAWDLSYAVVSALARQQESFIEMMTKDVWSLEQRVTGGHMGNPEEFLEELFRSRHGLIAVRTMASLACEAYGRTLALGRFVPPEDVPLVKDILDQFERVASLADGEKEYLQGVIEFYSTRTETKMTIAAERLAVIAVVTLPITALSSIYGMNVIVNADTQVTQLVILLVIMTIVSAWLLRWARKQGWW